MTAADRLAELAALADAATPEPWTTEGPWSLGHTVVGPRGYLIDAVDGGVPCMTGPDAAFIAASREAVPALIAALRAVLDLHESSLDTRDVGRVIDGEWTPYCEECGDPYPCAEVRAIDAALGVTS
jgi:hypothetical protein